MGSPEELGLHIRGLAQALSVELCENLLSMRIEALKTALSDAQTADFVAMVFLGEHGLPAMIRHLRGSYTPDSSSIKNSASTALSFKAAETLGHLLGNIVVISHVSFEKTLVPGLLAALRDAPHDFGRCVAATALVIHGAAEEEHRKAIAEAGGVGCLLAAYTGVGDSAWESGGAESILELGRMLVGSGGVGTRDLIKAMRGPEPLLSFAAVSLLQVGHACSLKDHYHKHNFYPLLRTPLTLSFLAESVRRLHACSNKPPPSNHLLPWYSCGRRCLGSCRRRDS
jgi:hypothetical protein